MTRTITTKLSLDGEAEYKARLKAINADLRLYKSQIDLVEAAHKTDANSLVALAEKEAALAGQLEALNQRHQAQADMLQKAENAQRSYQAEIAELQRQLDMLVLSSGDTAEAEKKLAEELSKAEERMQRAANSIAGYQKDLNYTERDQLELNRTLEDTRKYLEEAKSSMDGTARSIDQYGNAAQKSASALETLAGAVAAAGTVKASQTVLSVLRESAEAATEFGGSMAGVRRTVGGTKEEIADLGSNFKQMSLEIPIATTALAKTAETAGQLGIAKKRVQEFTQVMAMLDTTTDLTADSAATMLAQFSNITGTDDYARMGAVIADLGDSTATTASKVVEMGQGMAATADAAGMTERNILGIAAATSSLGIEAEAGSTAMNTLISTVHKAVETENASLKDFASIANMSADQFAAAWRENAAGALNAFIQGLNDTERNGRSAIVILDELGITNQRQIKAIQGLSRAGDLLSSTLEQADRAWAENTALMEKASIMYETTEAKMTIAANAANLLKVAVGDALTPALENAAEAGTDAFTWAAGFAEDNPELIRALAGATAGIVALGTGLTVAAAAEKAFQLATKEMTAEVVASKIAILGTAAGVAALVGAIAMLAASSNSADDSVRELRQELEASKSAYEENTKSIKNSMADVQALASYMESLAAVENKSSYQKQALLEVVDQLNEAVPGLSLAYDELTDSLNLSTDAIREMVEAQAQQALMEEYISRSTELQKERLKITYQQEAAEEALRAARENAASAELGSAEQQEYAARIEQLKRNIHDLNQVMEDNQREIDALREEYGPMLDTLEDAGDAAEDAGKGIDQLSSSAGDAAKQGSALEEAMSSLTEASKSLTGAVSKLDTALKEQADSGSLSLNTALELIDAGYGTALAIDKETGTIELNQAAYIRLAQTKIDNQIESIQLQLALNNERIRMNDTALMATELGEAYATAAEARAAMLGENRSFAAQIAALEQLRDRLNNYSVAATSSAAASKAMQTQAQKDLAEYKNLVAELDHQRNLDAISERDYYTKLKEYRDRYLTDEDNLDEYRRITEQIYKYDKDLVDREVDLWTEQTDALVSELEGRVKAVENQRDQLKDKLSGYGDLFTKDKNGNMSLENIQKDIDAMEAWVDTIERLKKRNISGSLMEEILGMDIDDATTFGQKLLSKSQEQFDKYNQLWDTKRQRAEEISKQFFEDQIDSLGTEYNDKLDNALDILTSTSFASGVDVGQGFIDGLASMEDAVGTKIQEIVDQVDSILDSAYKASGKIPSNLALSAAFESYSVREPVPATAQDMRESIAAGVNGLASIERPVYVTVESTMNVDSKRFFTETLPVQRAVARANPEVKSDR